MKAYFMNNDREDNDLNRIYDIVVNQFSQKEVAISEPDSTTRASIGSTNGSVQQEMEEKVARVKQGLESGNGHVKLFLKHLKTL